MSILKLVLKAAAPLPDIEKSERYLFIGPHPDDIEIGAGATAAKLAAMGLKVYLPGGRLKPSTQALVGTEAVQNLSCYNFTKGFFGANGISSTAGFSTPDFSESKVKTEAMQHCRKCFVLADSSKFKRISVPDVFIIIQSKHDNMIFCNPFCSQVVVVDIIRKIQLSASSYPGNNLHKALLSFGSVVQDTLFF